MISLTLIFFRNLKTGRQILKLSKVNKHGLVNASSFRTSARWDNEVGREGEPPIPVTCCGSGCQNCVWVEYAQKLLDYYKGKYSDGESGLRKALTEIEKLEDENLKTFIKMEINFRLKN